MEQKENLESIKIKKNEHFILILLFFYIFLILSFRPVGLDNDSIDYQRIIFEFLNYSIINDRIELSFYAITKIFSTMLSPELVVRLVFVFYAFLSVLLMFYSFRRYSLSPLYSLLLYSLSYLLLAGFNQIRGGVAISIFLLALKDFHFRKNFNYFTKILIAFVFHYMSLIFFAVYFIAKIKNKIFWILLPVIGIFINIVFKYSALGGFSFFDLNTLGKSLPLYDIFITKLGHKEHINILNIWNILLILDFVIFSWIVVKKKVSDINYSMWKIFSFSIFIYHILAVSGYIVLTYRISEALNAILLIMIPNMILKYKVKPKYLFLLFFTVQYIYYFYHLIVDTQAIHF